MTTDNRTSEPTPEQVEAAAKVLADYEWVAWAVVPDHIKAMYRAQARAALVAAQEAAPVLPSSTVDEEKLAKAIDKALIRHGEMAGMSNQERWDARDDIARAVVAYFRGES